MKHFINDSLKKKRIKKRTRDESQELTRILSTNKNSNYTVPLGSSAAIKDCNALGCITKMVGSSVFQIHCNQSKTQKYTCKIDIKRNGISTLH